MPTGFDLGTAFAKIELDASGIADGISKAKSSIADGVKDIGDSLTSIGSNMTLLGAPFLAFGAAAVKSFTDSQNAMAQLDAVLRSTTAHNGEFTTSTKLSSDEIESLQGKLDDATDKLQRMETVYNSATEHTTAQTVALDAQRKKVAELSASLKEGTAQTTSMINVTHMSRQALIDMASALQNVTTYSDETILSAESMLLTFTNIGEKVFPEATKTVLDMSTALGQDTKSSAIQLGKALNDPIKGITALQRVGVAFTESQKELIKQLVNAGKVEEAQKLILKELQVEFGGSAVAAGQTFAGQLARVKNQVDDVMESIGEKLIPVVTSLVNHIVDVVNWFATLDPHLQDIIIGFGVLMASLAILGPIIAGIGAAIGAVGSILAGVGTVIGVLMGPVGLLIAAGAAIVYLFKDQIGGAISSFIAMIQAGVTPLRALAALIVDTFGSSEITRGIATFLLNVEDFFNHFQERVQLFGSLFKLYFEYYIGNPLSDLWAKVQPALQNLLNWFVNDGLPWIQNALLFLWNNVLTPVINVLSGIWEAVKEGLTRFGDWFLSPGGGMQQIIEGLLAFKTNAIDPFIKAMGYMTDQAGKSLDMLKTIFKSAFDWIYENVIKPATRQLDSFMEKLIPASSLGQSTGGTYYQGGAIDEAKNYWAKKYGNGVVPIPPVGGGSAAGLGYRADGGNVAAGMPYIVGERGPELFTPNQNGSITPNNQLAGFTWTGDLNITANDYAGGRAATAGALDEIEARYRSRGN